MHNTTVERQVAIRIAHISDPHFSESLDEGETEIRAPGRYGHDPDVLSALQALLLKAGFDALVVSGDLSRIGDDSSFAFAQLWLESHWRREGKAFGLDLRARQIPYVVVPGNHDRFDGHLMQRTLSKYKKYFPQFCEPYACCPIIVDGVTIRFHLFDSSFEGGGFAVGKCIQFPADPCSPKEPGVDVAVIHHHVVQPPHHVREAATELQNASTVLAHFFTKGYDALLFGHTHRSYFGVLSKTAVRRLMSKRQKRGWGRRVLRSLIARLWSRVTAGNVQSQEQGFNLLGYQRLVDMHGRNMSLESHLDYLSLLSAGYEVTPPSAFSTPSLFYKHLEDVAQMNGQVLPSAEGTQLLERIAVSMAATACQRHEPEQGMVLLEITVKESGHEDGEGVFRRLEHKVVNIQGTVYEYDAGSSSFVQRDGRLLGLSQAGG